MSTSFGLPGSRLAQLAATLLDEQTMKAIVLPALGDLQHECAEARGSRFVRGLIRVNAYWAVFKVLGYTIVGTIARDTVAVAPTMIWRWLATLTILTVLLVWPPLSAMWPPIAERLSTRELINLGVLMLPQALVLSLTSAFVIALATTRLRSSDNRGRVLSSAIGGSIVCGLLVMALTIEIIPRANQTFRVVIYDALRASDAAAASVALPKGLVEMTWRELAAVAANPPSPQQGRAARVQLHLRFVLSLAPMVLGLITAALLAPLRRRSVALLGSIALLIAYWGTLSLVNNWGVEGEYSVPAAWAPTMIFGAFAVVALRRGYHRAPAQAADFG